MPRPLPPFTVAAGRALDLAELTPTMRPKLGRVLLWRDTSLMLLAELGGTHAEAIRVQAVADALARRILDAEDVGDHKTQ